MSMHPGPTSHPGDPPLHCAVTTALTAMAVMLLLTWAAAWYFNVGQVVVWAASLVIVVIGLVAIGLQFILRTGGRADAARQGAQPGQERQDFGRAPASADPLPAAAHGKRWSLEVFAGIDAQRFAAVCETWFSWAGFDTRSESHRTREGVDIWLHAAKVPGPVAIVRCKHGQDKPVGIEEMQDFQGLVAACRSAHGTYTTTSTYTAEALQYAREHGIDAVDGRGLLRKILTRTRQSQQALLAVAYNGR